MDGSFGEGGGQILRTAVAFSVIQGRPIHVTKIRAGREVPGLRQQHVSTLRTLGEIFSADLHGADLGSSEITFSPGRAKVSSMKIDMKTAASITLLLQAVIPAVALGRTSLSLEVTGGTDVPWSPTFDYFSAVVAEAYRSLGISTKLSATRRGYYPKGGGQVKAEILPAAALNPVNLSSPPGRPQVDLVSRCAKLPRHVAERQLEAMAAKLASSGVDVDSKLIGEEAADSPGSSVLASAVRGGWMAGADAIGARGKPAEAVGLEAAGRLLSVLERKAPVDANLADMIAPLVSLASGSSTFLVPEVSQHLKTGLYVAKLFTGSDYSWKRAGTGFIVSVRPVFGHNA